MGRTKEEKKISDAAYRERNREKIRDRNREWARRDRQLNPTRLHGKRKEQSRKYYEKRKGEIKAYVRNWKQANRDRENAKLRYKYSTKEAKDKRHQKYLQRKASGALAAYEERVKGTSIIQRRKEYKKRHLKEHPELYRQNRRNRKARVKGAQGKHTASDIKAIFQRQKGICATPNCGASLHRSGKNIMHVDHIMPLVLGGSNDAFNIQLLCPPCNLIKAAKHPDEWAKRNGLLFI